MTIDFENLVADRETDESIKHWVRHGRVPSILILLQAEQLIYQRLRVRQMLTTATGSLAANADTIALSSAAPLYRGPRHFMFTGIHKSVPDHVAIEQVIEKWSYDSAGARTKNKPSAWSTDADNIQFDVQADQAYAWNFLYYAEKPPLDATNNTNFLTTTYISLLYAAVLTKGNEFLKNSRETNHWLAVLEKEIYEANKEADLERAGEQIDMQWEGY